MRADVVRDLFERVEGEPSSQFSVALLARLQAEYLDAGVDNRRVEERPMLNDGGPVIDLVDEQPRLRRGRSGPEQPSRRLSRRRLVVAAAAATALIVGTAVVVATGGNDGAVRIAPADSDPGAKIDPPAPLPPLPDGLKALPPAGATPSTPVTGQLVAPLPIPIWVYEDGRIISARWTTHSHWTGFLEQRLTPEGVELVRAEILALDPLEDCRDGLGNYWYGDGSRDVCESPGDPPNVGPVDPMNLYPDHPQYQRLSELQYGAPSWLPESAWADPQPKPYVPSAYLIVISNDPAAPWRGPLDTTAMLAALPPEAAELLISPEPCPVFGAPTASPGLSAHTSGVCFRVTTETAQHVGTAIGITENSAPPGRIRNGDTVTELDMGVSSALFAGYQVGFTPYLPHGAPVACCAG